MAWYSLHVHSGNELFVKRAITKLIEDYNMEDRIEEILVPTEDIIEIKKGEEVIKEKALYPAYVFVKGDLDIDAQHKIRNISKVLSFVGEKGIPATLSQKDIDTIMDKVINKQKARYKLDFLEGEEVLIKEGSFENFKARVESFDPKTGSIHVMVNILGRDTPVELEVGQVSKVV
jgi:transcriptional antiterminator NusG